MRDALERLHTSDGISYAVRRACEQYVETAEDYVVRELEVLEERRRYLLKLKELADKSRLPLSDKELDAIRERAVQTKLYGFDEGQQRRWLSGRGFPTEHQDEIIEMIEELCQT